MRIYSGKKFTTKPDWFKIARGESLFFYPIKYDGSRLLWTPHVQGRNAPCFRSIVPSWDDGRLGGIYSSQILARGIDCYGTAQDGMCKQDVQGRQGR
jgi:hypothetical protein